MHTHLEQWAADIAVPREQLGIRCLALGSHLSRGHFLPDPGFEPTNVGYLGFQVHRSIGPQLPKTNLFYMHLTSPQHSTTTMISTINLNTSGGPLSALTCCVNARLLSAIKKISPLIYSQSWVGSWVYTTQAMMTFTLIF